MAAIASARNAAFRILLAVERGEDHSDNLLRAKSVTALSVADRNLATTLVMGVLRWQIALDEAIKKNLARPNAKLDVEVRIALRLGAFQLLCLDRIPAHAAIDESVELVKRAGHRFAAGMVNAVLRKMASADASGAAQATEEGRALAPATAAYPAWMADRWTQIYGREACCAICAHGQQQPQLAIRLIDPAAEAELKASGVDLAPGALLTAARIVLAGDVAATAAFREGRVRIQDEGSQLIAEIAASAVTDLVQDEKKILDACAAPGGKTLILAERSASARIVACEASPQRLGQLAKRLSPYGRRIECRLADAAALKEQAVFDLALADVPCSGTGTLGRNPEIRHRIMPADLPRQAERQRGLLRAALRAVRPGGRVVYSTCSLEPEENEEVVAAVLATSSSARQVSVGSRIEELLGGDVITAPGAEHLRQCVTPEGALRLVPGALPTDGFFVALFEKTVPGS